MVTKFYNYLFSGFKPVIYFLVTPVVLVGVLDLNIEITITLLKVFFGMGLFNLFVFYILRKPNVSMAEKMKNKGQSNYDPLDPSDPRSPVFNNDSSDAASYNYSPGE